MRVSLNRQPSSVWPLNKQNLDRTITPERQFPAKLFLARRRVHSHRYCQIPRGDSIGFEQGDFGVAGASADLARNHIAKLLHARPADFIPLERDNQVARFRSEERRVGKECRSRWSPYH